MKFSKSWSFPACFRDTRSRLAIRTGADVDIFRAAGRMVFLGWERAKLGLLETSLRCFFFFLIFSIAWSSPPSFRHMRSRLSTGTLADGHISGQRVNSASSIGHSTVYPNEIFRNWVVPCVFSRYEFPGAYRDSSGRGHIPGNGSICSPGL